MTHPRAIDACHASIRSEEIYGLVPTLERLEAEYREADNHVRVRTVMCPGHVLIDEANERLSDTLDALDCHREHMAAVLLRAARLVIPGITTDIIRRII